MATEKPSRRGQPWNEDEIIKLLKSIKDKKTNEEIAKEHDRTIGGINSYIRKMALDYYYNDKRSIEEIQKFTGLSKEQIEDAIKKHELKITTKKSSESIKHKVEKATEDEMPTMLEVVLLLKDIQGKLNMLIEKVS
jgi:predicted DNA-binding protein YlxM (UPF0122 family)